MHRLAEVFVVGVFAFSAGVLAHDMAVDRQCDPDIPTMNPPRAAYELPTPMSADDFALVCEHARTVNRYTAGCPGVI